MFGLRRRREAAAAEAAREGERRALFAQLAQRPRHVCPFLGLAYERTGYVEGASIEHRCYAFGDPAPLSAEQQTRVCQDRGYGQCPRYLRGLLLTPGEDLEALRNPQAAIAAAAAASAAAQTAASADAAKKDAKRAKGAPGPPGSRRRTLAGAVVLLLAVVLAGGVVYLAVSQGWLDSLGIGLGPVASSTATLVETAAVSAEQSPTARPSPPASPEAASSREPDEPGPSPEARPTSGDTFAFYEVAVTPGSYPVFPVDDAGTVGEPGTATFEEISFAQVEPIDGADGEVYWRTVEGGLQGFGYRYPDSGDFRIRAVFLDSTGERRSVYLDEDELDDFPEATPAP